MTLMEQKYVHDVYNKIAKHFDATRYHAWPGVRSFLSTIPKGSSILEIGCGNGKNLGERLDCTIFGCDTCESLIEYAQKKNPTANLTVANGLALPYKDKSMDVVISIAVLHHLSSFEARRKFLSEFARVYNGKGGAFVTVWSHDAIRPSWIPMKERGDYLVPWNYQIDGTIYQRYYHVFDKEEIMELFEGILTILTIRLECDNWYVYV
jgi:ubiquinone/menaquinone biosynthesis C-methylase UbiE